MEYISYQSVENILKEYNSITALIASIQIELQAAYIKGAKEEEGDVIYGLVLGNRRMDGMPKPPYSISDTTFNVAISYRQSVKNTNYKEIRRLSQEVLELSVVLEKIDTAMGALSDYEKGLVKKLYINGQSLSQLSENQQEEIRLRRERKAILEKMAKIVRIPEEAYLDLMSKVRA